MLLSEFMGKEVLIVKTADFAGIVIGAYMDKLSKKITNLMVEKDNIKYMLDLNKVVGNMDKVTIYYQKYLVPYSIEENENLYPLDKTIKCYTTSGADLGNFQDIHIKGGKLVWFDKPYFIKSIVGMKDENIIINLDQRLPKDEDPKPKLQKEVSPYIPEEKIINDYSFLLGRIVIRDIIDKTNDLYIKKGTVINSNTIEQAKNSGKLVYLALSSLLD